MNKFMIIERYKSGCWDAIYERFDAKGRMLPDGLCYLNSWVSKEKQVCYQLMETNAPELLETWFQR
ncbi:MAG: DUF3303 domain-containing protein [Alphaproteobacteria bacterium]|jgi:hypothetical protein